MKTQLLTMFSLLALLITFQNCGKVDFKYSGATLKASDPVTSMGGLDNNPITSESGSPVINNPPVVSNGPSNPPSGSGSESFSDSSLVECELGGSNAKIILSGSMVVGSNAKDTRICMSENACLNLVNSFAQVRNCSLSQGAPLSDNISASCTQVFPGSQGTCKNAQVLSDDDVSKLLLNMSI
jgi:hypothetical protein